MLHVLLQQLKSRHEHSCKLRSTTSKSPLLVRPLSTRAWWHCYCIVPEGEFTSWLLWPQRTRCDLMMPPLPPFSSRTGAQSPPCSWCCRMCAQRWAPWSRRYELINHLCWRRHRPASRPGAAPPWPAVASAAGSACSRGGWCGHPSARHHRSEAAQNTEHRARQSQTHFNYSPHI